MDRQLNPGSDQQLSTHKSSEGQDSLKRKAAWDLKGEAQMHLLQLIHCGN